MKDTLASLLRHALTALAGAGTFMAGRGLIAPEDAEAVNASGATIQDALVVVVVAVLMRLALKFGGKFFSADTVGKSDGGGVLLLLLGVAGLLGMMGLPSCTPRQWEAVKAFPLKACYIDKDGNSACYSSKGGLEVEVISAK
jgi:hypothetical protein